jgi:glycosyltransferase involved in cell wall biosynthesis
MKIAYVTHVDSDDINAWSGLFFNIKKALRDRGHEIIPIVVAERFTFFLRLKKIFFKHILRKNYLRDRSPFRLRAFAKQIDEQIKTNDCDIIFAPGSLYFAYLPVGKPVTFWTDASFAGMINYYPHFTNLCAESLRDGHKAEELSLARSALAIYSSTWAARGAIDAYKLNSARVKVVPFGANIDCARTEKDIRQFVKDRSFGVCRLLFVGVDWLRKGGATALEVAIELNKRGYRTELHVVGCSVPHKVPDFVVQHGFLSKASPSDLNKIDKLFSTSNFFILPSLAECYGVVFAEASSYGLPSLATDTGGISSVIKNNVNGFLFSIDAKASVYCDCILENSDRNKYEKLVVSSFEQYHNELNWAVAGNVVNALISRFDPLTENISNGLKDSSEGEA